MMKNLPITSPFKKHLIPILMAMLHPMNVRAFGECLSPKPSNLGRQPEVDLSRGCAAVLIIIVHVGLFLGNDIHKGLWTFCDIIGSEPYASPLRMEIREVADKRNYAAVDHRLRMDDKTLADGKDSRSEICASNEILGAGTTS